MASAVIGQLRALLIADTAQFDKAMAGATTDVKKLAATIEKDLAGSQTRVNKLVREFGGSDVIGRAKDYAKAVEAAGGAARLTAQHQEKVNDTVVKALSHYKALGQQAPPQLIALANATKQAQAPTAALGGNLDALAGKAKMLAGAFGVTLGAGALLSFGKSVFNAADKIVDLANKMGVSTDAAQRFQFAARQAGAEIEDVSQAIVRMSANLAEGDKSTVDALEAVGLKFADIRAQKPEDAFRSIADAIGGISDPMLQAKVAMELFGKSGASLLPMIREGALAASDGARIMASETVKALEAAQQSWENFWNDITIVTANALGAMLPQIKLFLNDLQKGFSFLARFAETMKTTGRIDVGLIAAFAEGSANFNKDKSTEQREFQTAMTPMASHGTKANFLSKEEREAATRKVKDAAKETDRFNDEYSKYRRLQLTGMTDDQRMQQRIRAKFLEEMGLTGAAAWGQSIISRTPFDMSLLGKGADLSYTPPGNFVNFRPAELMPEWLANIQRMMGSAKPDVSVSSPSPFGQAMSGFLGQSPEVVLQALQGGGNVAGSLGALFGGKMSTSLGGKFTNQLSNSFLGKNLGGAVGSSMSGIASMGMSAVLSNGGGKGMLSNIASYAAAGSIIPGIGTAIGAGIGAVVGAFKANANNTKKLREEFAKSMGLSDMGELAKKLQTLGAQGGNLANIAANVIGKNDQAANKKWMQDVTSFLEKVEKARAKIGQLGDLLTPFGGLLPAGAQSAMQALLANPNLPAELKAQLQGMSGGQPSWQVAAERASARGISTGALGQQFNQSRVASDAFGILHDLELFLKFGGANQDELLTGLADELSAVAAESRKTNTSLPKQLQEFIKRVSEMGLLVDEAGNNIEFAALSFADLKDEALDQVVSLLEEIRDLLAPAAVAGVAGGAAPRWLGPPTSPAFFPAPNMPSDAGMVDGSFDGFGASMTAPAATYNIYAIDGKTTEQWLRQGGADQIARELPDATARYVGKR